MRRSPSRSSAWTARTPGRLARAIAVSSVAADDPDPQAVAGEGLEQLGRRRGADQATLVEDRDVVAHPLDVVEDVGRVEDRRLVASEVAHEVEDLAPADRVERADRLVEEEDPRPSDQRLADAEPLAHPARVGLRPAVAGVGQADLAEDLVDPGRGRRSTGSGESEATNAERLATGHPVVEARAPGRGSRPAAGTRRRPLSGMPVDGRRAGGRPDEAAEDLEGGRLARRRSGRGSRRSNRPARRGVRSVRAWTPG